MTHRPDPVDERHLGEAPAADAAEGVDDHADEGQRHRLVAEARRPRSSRSRPDTAGPRSSPIRSSTAYCRSGDGVAARVSHPARPPGARARDQTQAHSTPEHDDPQRLDAERGHAVRRAAGRSRSRSGCRSPPGTAARSAIVRSHPGMNHSGSTAPDRNVRTTANDHLQPADLERPERREPHQQGDQLRDAERQQEAHRERGRGGRAGRRGEPADDEAGAETDDDGRQRRRPHSRPGRRAPGSAARSAAVRSIPISPSRTRAGWTCPARC